MANKTFCDICNKEVTSETLHRVRIEVFGPETVQPSRFVDTCPDHFAKLNDAIATALKPE